VTTSDAELWDDLLFAIEDSRVVPIVGRDLLTLETASGPRLLHHVVAERLAADLGIPTSGFPAGFDTNDVICAYDGFHGDPTAIAPRVLRVLKGLRVDVPEPLRLLAEIPNFQLFVSTSFDDLLERALVEVRGRRPAVVAFPAASSQTDFHDDLIQTHGSVVFHILGRASASSSFAVTEGQVLEQMHELMSGARRPEGLIARLQESHLLILGVSFPDWLGRFLLRLARSKPLWDSRPIMEIIADGGSGQAEFAGFVRHFSPQKSRLFTAGSPFELVREMHRRWFERHPAAAVTGDTTRLMAQAERPEPMEPGAIFVSYASEDRPLALRLADGLAAGGLDVWIDRRLLPGDDYQSIIEQHIRECSAFIPVISRNTQQDDDRWFRREWRQACDRAQRYFGTDRGFLFPVVVDGTPNAELNELRRETFGRTAARAADGVPPDDLILQLDRAQKAWRRQYARV
jgi:hypothetical protein